MTKALRNIKKEDQQKAIERRIASNTKGLGYWAAVDAKKKIEKKNTSKQIYNSISILLNWASSKMLSCSYKTLRKGKSNDYNQNANAVR